MYFIYVSKDYLYFFKCMILQRRSSFNVNSYCDVANPRATLRDKKSREIANHGRTINLQFSNPDAQLLTLPDNYLVYIFSISINIFNTFQKYFKFTTNFKYISMNITRDSDAFILV